MTDFQNEPLQDSNNATDAQKIDGIVGQVRADIALGNADNARELLTERLKDAGIEASAIDFEGALATIIDQR
jgi:hypothetical protein